MQRLREHGIFLIIFVLSTLLRFLPLFDYQFTFDELSGLDRTQFNDLSTLLEKGVKVDAHPALIQLFIFFLVKQFGYVTWVVKLPFLIFGQLALIYAYLIGVRNFSKQTGLVASVLFSFSLIFVFYAPIARMYSAGIFFSLALLYYFFELVFHKRSDKRIYVWFSLFAHLSALNHHINGLFAFTIAGSAMVLISKEQRKPFLLACLFAVLAYLPHMPITLYQLSIPGIGVEAGGWLTRPEWTVFPAFVQVLLGTGWCFVVFLIVVIARLWSGTMTWKKQSSILAVLFLVNFSIVFFYSLLRAPIFQFSVMLFSGTAFILLVSSFCDFQKIGLNRLILSIIFFMLVGRTYFQKDYLHQAVKTVYEYQFTQTAEYKARFGNEEVYPVFFDCDTLMRNIYFKNHQLQFDLRMSGDTIINNSIRSYVKADSTRYKDTIVSTLRLFAEFVRDLNADFLVLSSAPPIYQSIAKEQFPYLIENTETQGINYKVYSKRLLPTVADDRILYEADHIRPGRTKFPAASLPLSVSADSEFPYKISTNLDNAVSKEGQFILTEFQVKLLSGNSRMLESCISINDSLSNEPYAYSGKCAADFLKRSDSIITIYSDAYIGSNYRQMKESAVINAYMWNRDHAAFNISTCKIKVIDYWPQKWQWWH